MNYYESEEQRKEAIAKKVDLYREAAGYMPTIAKIVQSFDGKVYNCRFDKAIEAALKGKVYVYKRWEYIHIYVLDHGHDITLASLPMKELNESKRIPAEKFLASLRQYRDELLKKAYDIETTIDQAANIKIYAEQTIEKINALLQKIPTEVREAYNIPYGYRKN